MKALFLKLPSDVKHTLGALTLSLALIVSSLTLLYLFFERTDNSLPVAEEIPLVSSFPETHTPDPEYRAVRYGE